MNRFESTVTALVLASLLTACAATNKKTGDEPSASLKAAETNTALGRQYMERGQYEVALEKLKRAVAFEKSYAPAHTMLGILYETINNDQMAGEEYRLAVHYDPDDGDVNNNYAAFLCSQGKGKEAQRYFETAFRDPFYATPEVAYANAGLCALGMGELDKAEKYLRQSLEYDAEITQSLLSMASINYRNGTYLSARAFLQRFESIAEPTPESLYLGFRIEDALGDTSAASQYRASLLSTFPNSAEAKQARALN